MKETLQAWLQKIKAAFLKINQKTRTLLGVLLGVIILGAVAIAIVLASRPYSVLFTGLTSDETASIVSYLEQSGVSNYRTQNNDTILVPKDQESQLKAKLLMEGYPKSGFAYSTYLSNVSSLSTESDRQTAFLFDLQDRMGAVIRCLDGVKDAWVTIASGEDRRYVLDSSNIVEASASVLVQMNDGKKLDSQEAAAIRNLVSRAVKGLSIENITITDTLGNTYSGGDSAVSGESSLLKLQLEEQVNNIVRTNIMQILLPFFGGDNIRVSVNSTVDVNRTTGDSTTYTEPAWAADGSTNGKGIIGSRVYDNVINRDGTQTVGGVAGTESNSDIENYVETQTNPTGTENTISSSGQVDYNVDTKHEQVQRTAGVVSDLMVSISINSSAADNIDKETLMGHVARAAGITPSLQDEKISILTMPFYKGDASDAFTPSDAIPQWVLYAAAAGGVLLLLLLLFFAAMRGRKRKRLEAKGASASEQPFIQPVSTDRAEIMNVNSEKSMELRKNIREFADNNPEIAAQMVKSWLKGDDENG